MRFSDSRRRGVHATIVKFRIRPTRIPLTSISCLCRTLLTYYAKPKAVFTIKNSRASRPRRVKRPTALKQLDRKLGPYRPSFVAMDGQTATVLLSRRRCSNSNGAAFVERQWQSFAANSLLPSIQPALLVGPALFAQLHDDRTFNV